MAGKLFIEVFTDVFSRHSDNVFFSTIKIIGKLRDAGDKIESPASLDFISLQQKVAIPTRINNSYERRARKGNVKGS